MEAELWGAVLRGGVGTLALLVLIIWIGKNGKVWVWARELHAVEKERVTDQANHQAEIARMERQHTVLVKERDEWRNVALDTLGVAEKITRSRDRDDHANR